MSEDPRVGAYFVSNYPPFGAWSADAVPAALARLATPPVAPAPLGVYAHVPFCRRRCRFCYFKVFTEQPASAVRAYVAALGAEAALWAAQPYLAGRAASFLYVGGGTPSFLSNPQLEELFAALRASFALTPDAEITFECEPGTLRPEKVHTLRRLGVTRLSIGVESFTPEVLELGGRAHGEAQIEPAFRMARDEGFPQVNLDLIAGMIGETEASWRAGIERTIALAPDSVTIYQLEIPGNTTLARTLREGGDPGGALHDVQTRRRWASEAFARLEEAGYQMTSGYTAVRGDVAQSFVYRNALWTGADLVGVGVSAFGHLGGVHLQNVKDLADHEAAVAQGRLPLQRAYALDADEQLVRALVLQLKLGRVELGPLRARFGVDPRARFATQWARLGDDVRFVDDAVVLTREALMRVDLLLPDFFLRAHGGRTTPREAA